jgi:Cupin domain
VERHLVEGSPFDVLHLWSAGTLALETTDCTDAATLGEIFVESMGPTATPTNWHRTNTIDYEYIVSGRIDLRMEDGSSVTLGPGDVSVQLGGMHQWWNRYEEPCVLVIVMVAVESDEAPGVPDSA